VKIATIVGARPQFIKAAPVSKALLEHGGIEEVVIHTGQHYDHAMSALFFEQLGMRPPNVRLDINGGRHGDMTGRMLQAIEPILVKQEPDVVLVYGDTNSTLAGALAASKLNIPVAHVEAGLRSFDRRMPEEVNRVLTDHLSDVLFAPTDKAVENLKSEGVGERDQKIVRTGDVMLDASLMCRPYAKPPAALPSSREGFLLATIHRAENTDDPERLKGIFAGLARIHKEVGPVVLPLHPRTEGALKREGIKPEVELIEPTGFAEMVWLLQRAAVVVTDSGGVQKEAYFFGKPCVTVRDTTEWTELVEANVNELVGPEADEMLDAVTRHFGGHVSASKGLYGDGSAALVIATELKRRFSAQ
jgi:UDP-GlcNAc3NAcA epimerase